MGYSAVSVFGDILSAMGRGISRKKKKKNLSFLRYSRKDMGTGS